MHMAHQTSHRRILAESDPKPSSMDTELKKQNKSKITLSQKPSCKNFSKSCTREKPTVSPEYKTVTVSASVDSSNFSLPKSNSHPTNYLPAPEIEKMSIFKKEGSKESQKKFYEFIVTKKKKSREGNESKSLTGEFKNGDFEELEGTECERRRQSASLSSRGGRRRSFGGAQVEMADIFASNGVKVVAVDMPPFMQIHAVDCARKSRDSMEKFTSKTLALTLKKEFDGVYGPAWHCVVGSSFGSFVTHSVGGFLYFSMDKKLYVLLFKTTVQKAD